MSDNQKTPEQLAGEVAGNILESVGEGLVRAAATLRENTKPEDVTVNRADETEDDLDEDLFDQDDDLDEDLDEDYDDEFEDDFVARPAVDIRAIDLGLAEGEVVYARVAATVNGKAGVLARTSSAVRLASAGKGDIPAVVASIAYADIDPIRTGVRQGADGGFAVIISPRVGVPIQANVSAIGATELQAFFFEMEREAKRATGQNPAEATMRAGWETPETATVTIETTETLTADQVPQPEYEGDDVDNVEMRDADDREAEGVQPAAGGSLERSLAQVAEIDKQVEKGDLSRDEARALKRRALGL